VHFTFYVQSLIANLLILCFVTHILFTGYSFAPRHPFPETFHMSSWKICASDTWTPLAFVGLGGVHTSTLIFMPQAPSAHKSRCFDAIFAVVTSVTSLDNSVYNSLKHRIKVLSHDDLRYTAKNFNRLVITH